MSAQAAASAAFSGTRTPTLPSSQKRKPSIRLNIDFNSSQSRIQTPKPLSYPETSTPRALHAGTPTPRNTPYRTSNSGKSGGKIPSSTPGRAHARRSSAAQKVGPVGGRSTPSSVGLPSSRGSRASLINTDDASSNEPRSIDYFSLPRSTSMSPHGHGNDTPRSKTPSSTKPSDMLEQVRNSINSKSKTGTSKEAARKSQLALNEFRQSVDQRRLISHHVSHCSSHEDIYKEPSSRSSSRQNSAEELYNNSVANRSQSSIGSVVSDMNNMESALLAPNFRISFDNNSSDNVSKSSASPHPPSPIRIPLSSQGVDRGLAVAGPENISKIAISPGQVMTPKTDEQEELPAKPGRKKPPPSYDSDFIESSGSDMESGGLLLESSDLDTDESEAVKFPLFPGISGKSHHRIGIFSKKKKKRDQGVVYDPDEPQGDENDLPLAPAANRSISKLVAQPVKLRTTMRKEHRKQKKAAFNEDKPWKNHVDLDAISDAQRKRYEGLWVSNKGLYLDHVATRLVGVDYRKEEDNALSKTVREYSEREISERAAKLSASVNVDFDSTDVKELHSLQSVSMQNLIHGSVVKKIWSRSNLPRETLQAIWDLVDCRKDSTLNKAEFIVGMWLVDQCLYGRKLPKSVNKSVWSSLGGLGVNVVIKKKRR